ncbi:MAG: hypothetical protein J6D28_04610 [Bacilli bacterium]|nr:hypothetical protein [Bacilli bacterium]
MEDVLNLIGSFGGLVILAALFVWTFLKDRVKNDDMLSRIDKSNENIAKSIDAINNTTEVLKEYIIKHDERAKRIDDNVEKLLER